MPTRVWGFNNSKYLLLWRLVGPNAQISLVPSAISRVSYESRKHGTAGSIVFRQAGHESCIFPQVSLLPAPSTVDRHVIKDFVNQDPSQNL